MVFYAIYNLHGNFYWLFVALLNMIHVSCFMFPFTGTDWSPDVNCSLCANLYSNLMQSSRGAPSYIRISLSSLEKVTLSLLETSSAIQENSLWQNTLCEYGPRLPSVHSVSSSSGEGVIHGGKLRTKGRGAWVFKPSWWGAQRHAVTWPLSDQVLLHRRWQKHLLGLGVEPRHQEGLAWIKREREDWCHLPFSLLSLLFFTSFFSFPSFTLFHLILWEQTCSVQNRKLPVSFSPVLPFLPALFNADVVKPLSNWDFYRRALHLHPFPSLIAGVLNMMRLIFLFSTQTFYLSVTSHSSSGVCKNKKKEIEYTHGNVLELLVKYTRKQKMPFSVTNTSHVLIWIVAMIFCKFVDC